MSLHVKDHLFYLAKRTGSRFCIDKDLSPPSGFLGSKASSLELGPMFDSEIGIRSGCGNFGATDEIFSLMVECNLKIKSAASATLLKFLWIEF
eukprot:Awhi_evm1s11484